MIDLWAIDSANLDPYQFRLMLHIARVGVCWKGVRTLSGDCGMSQGKVSATRNWLEENGYIKKTIDLKSGKVGYSICEQWERSPHEQTQQNCSPHEQDRSLSEHQRSPHEQDRSPHELKTITKDNNFKTITVKHGREEENPFPFQPVPEIANKPKGESPAQARVTAILKVCGLNSSVPAHVRQAENIAAQINFVSAGYILDRYTVCDNPNGHWQWYVDDWRGQKGQQPTPRNLLDTIELKRVDVQENGSNNAIAKNIKPVVGEF